MQQLSITTGAALLFASLAAAQTPECTGAEPACDDYSYAADFDADGVDDDVDNCLFSSNPDQPDGDGDGRGDDCDNCPVTANFDGADVDADGLGDSCDPDADNDSLENIVDNCILVSNVGQQNDDLDIFGNACDDNDDEDNCPDATDNCPNAAAADCTTPGIFPNTCFPDEDADGIADALDNCFASPNLDQSDGDGDGRGDSCDADFDDDGVDNTVDNCLASANVDQTDADRDFRGDACDPFQCFVITDEASCLNSAGPFDVHAGPDLSVATGVPELLHIFANVEGATIDYTWTITNRPAASATATIRNSSGAVRSSLGPEYVYDVGARAEIVADVAGVYRVELSATSDGESATAELFVDAEGEPVVVSEGEGEGEGDEGDDDDDDDLAPVGCACAGSSNASVEALLAVVASLSIRRRRGVVSGGRAASS